MDINNEPPTADTGKSPVSSGTQVVTFTLAGEEYAVDILKVKEVILATGVTKVPQMPACVSGIINLRGVIVPVVDLRRRFSLPAAPPDEHTRIMIIRLEKRVAGLIVDTVSQVMKIPARDITPPPETIAGMTGKYLTGVARTATGLMMLIDIAKILDPKELAELAAVS